MAKCVSNCLKGDSCNGSIVGLVEGNMSCGVFGGWRILAGREQGVEGGRERGGGEGERQRQRERRE